MSSLSPRVLAEFQLRVLTTLEQAPEGADPKALTRTCVETTQEGLGLLQRSDLETEARKLIEAPVARRRELAEQILREASARTGNTPLAFVRRVGDALREARHRAAHRSEIEEADMNWCIAPDKSK
jgi:hypothetical protein